jgi:hypothetical protein
MRLNLISVNVAKHGWPHLSPGLKASFHAFFLSRQTRAPPPRGPILPRPKQPPATYPARCIKLLLHEPGISSWIYPLVTPTLSSSVCKIGLARAAISRRMGLANLGHRMSHRSDIFQYRQTSSSCRYRRSWTPCGCNCNLSTRHSLDLPH